MSNWRKGRPAPGNICKRQRDIRSKDDMVKTLPIYTTTRGKHIEKGDLRDIKRSTGRSFNAIFPLTIRFFLVIVIFILIRWNIEAQKLSSLQSTKVTSAQRVEISFMALSKIRQSPIRRPTTSLQRPRSPDFGGLDLFPSKSRPSRGDGHSLPKPRKIQDHSHVFIRESHDSHDEFDKNFEPKYSPDEDDYLEDSFEDESYSEDLDPERVGVCRRSMIRQLHFPTCNNFHEMNLIESKLKYLGRGDFRRAGVISHEMGTETENLVIKHIHLGGFQGRKKSNVGNYDQIYRDFYWMRMDAMVAERLTASPRIYDVYGHCGLSLFTEFFRHGTIEDVLFTDENDSDDSRSEDEAGIPVARNDLSPSQKLELALNLAEAVADLHGHVDGAIVHQDITPSQLMWNEDRTMVKLNDFNRAEFMLWNDKRGQYCDYRQPDIRYNRSPEEAGHSSLQNEKVDVFNLSSIFYAILTGRWTLADNVNKVRSKFGGKLVISDNFRKSCPEEALLTEMINRCRERNPAERPSIFAIVKKLRNVQRKLGGVPRRRMHKKSYVIRETV